MQPALEGGSAQGYPGGILALSSNGTSNGILWALNSLTTTQNERGPGNLTAFDAATLSMLWTSTDSMLLSTFAEPTVINGRVYVPTWNQGLLVYANH
jgi:outer membrane protein assembly factor BamB